MPSQTPNARTAARLSLGALVIVTFVLAVDPAARFESASLRGDLLVHAAIAYGLTVALSASLPRAPWWMLLAIVLSTGAALEGLQALGLFAGDPDPQDMAANVVGVACAVLPTLGRPRLRAIGRASFADEPDASCPGDAGTPG